MIDRMTAGQLLEALAGADPDTVVVHEGLYVGPAGPIPQAAADWDRARRDAQAVIDLGNQLARFGDKVGKLARDRRAGR